MQSYHWQLTAKQKACFAVLFLLLTFSLSACENRHLYKDARMIMGTFVEVISPNGKALGIVFAELERVEGLLSKYKEESEISRLNKAGSLKLSQEAFCIIKDSKRLFELTGGAFDITVGPLLDLWGFTSKEPNLPSDKQIEESLKFVGFDKIVLNEADNVVKLKLYGVKLDLGAVAKGFAVDLAAAKLREAGIKSCLINAGGDIYCLGSRFGRSWRVAVKRPRGTGFAKYLDLRDRAVATSGDYEQCFFKRGKLFSHIIDPRTGRPARSGVISVTIAADNCMTADALATAVFALGKEKGSALVEAFPGAEIISLVLE